MDLNPALTASLTVERPRLDRATNQLIGSRCAECGAMSWPARAVCHRCGSAELELAALSRRATLRTFTEVWVKRPGLDPPYTLGQVDLEDGPNVFTHVRGLAGEARVPLAVEIVVGAEGEVPAFWVEPIDRSKEEEGR